jgi:hypothetical protein
MTVPIWLDSVRFAREQKWVTEMVATVEEGRLKVVKVSGPELKLVRRHLPSFHPTVAQLKDLAKKHPGPDDVGRWKRGRKR